MHAPCLAGGAAAHIWAVCGRSTHAHTCLLRLPNSSVKSNSPSSSKASGHRLTIRCMHVGKGRHAAAAAAVTDALKLGVTQSARQVLHVKRQEGRSELIVGLRLMDVQSINGVLGLIDAHQRRLTGPFQPQYRLLDELLCGHLHMRACVTWHVCVCVRPT